MDQSFYDDVTGDTLTTFRDYHRKNPEIWPLFVRFAAEAKAAGHKEYSAKTIFERIRWEISIVNRGQEFKLNNNFTSLYARLLMAKDANFKDFFEVRKLTK